jgi:hypothetical protein
MRLVSIIAIVLLLPLPELVAGAEVAVPAPPALETHVHSVGLFDWLFGGRDDRRRVAPVPRPHPRRQEELRSSGDGTYRTLCVRLCDGFYFPISFATPRSKLAEDAKRCERQCPIHSRLYVYRNPGENVEEMVGLDGTPYAKLPTAFRFRSGYVADCTCHGNPWDAEAIARHQSYPAAQSLAAAGVSEERRQHSKHRDSRYTNRTQQDANAD